MGMSISASGSSIAQLSQPISPPAPVAPKVADSAAPSIMAMATQSLPLNTSGYLGTLLNMST